MDTKIFLILILLIANLPKNAVAQSKEILVKVYCTSQDYDYYEPWKKMAPNKRTGSGFIINNKRIITNAHVVSNAEFIQVRKEGKVEIVKAYIEYISHENDLAILKLDDDSFFKDIKPLAFEKLAKIEDQVTVLGFPVGGDKISITKGIVSRIEHVNYSHSNKMLLAYQIDAAINPGNSGGPVIKDGKIIGVAFQNWRGESNIGYIIPSLVLLQFLKDVEDNKLDGIPLLGIKTQELESASHRAYLNLTTKSQGILVTNIYEGFPLKNKILADDVLMEIDGHPIAYEGTIELESIGQVYFDFIVQTKQLGENVTLKYFRKDKLEELKVILDSKYAKTRPVPDLSYETPPNYYIYGGLIFETLTFNFLKAWGDNFTTKAPTDLVNLYSNEKPDSNIKEIVILISTLAADCNVGYQNWNCRIIKSVNGQAITSLSDLIQKVESNTEPFQVFEDKNNFKLILNTKETNQNQSKILEHYGIKAAKTEDIK